MSLSDEINELAVTPTPSNQTCRTCKWYKAQTEKDQAAFDAFIELIRSGEQQCSRLWKLCTTHGLDAGESAFRDHVRRHASNAFTR